MSLLGIIRLIVWHSTTAIRPLTDKCGHHQLFAVAFRPICYLICKRVENCRRRFAANHRARQPTM